MATEYKLSYSASEINEKLGSIDNKVDMLKAWEPIDIEEITGIIYRDDMVKVSMEVASCVKTRISNYEKVRVSGYQWDAASLYSLCIFLDVNNTVISTVALTTGVYYTDYEINVPNGAETIIVNGRTSAPIKISGYKIYDISTLNDVKANRISEWKTLSGSVKTGYLMNGVNGENEVTHGNGMYKTFDVTGLKKVKVSGWEFSIEYAYGVCYFYDVYGNCLGKHFGDADSTQFLKEIDVPDNAVTLKVNGHIYSNTIDVEGYKSFDVIDLYNEFRPKGKKLITLGDSITALGTTSTGWIKYFIEKTGCELIANVAVNGAWLNDKAGTVYDGNPVFNGADANVNNTLGNQVQKIINEGYEAPDIIMIAIGTNNGISITKEQIKSVYYDSNNALIPLGNVDRTTSAGAYRWCLDKLHETYPNAIIFWCTPIMGCQSNRSAENAMDYAESLRIATEYTGQIMIDTIRCGINGINEVNGANGQYLVDGLHPNVNGARKIGYYNASKVMPFINNGFVLQ